MARSPNTGVEGIAAGHKRTSHDDRTSGTRWKIRKEMKKTENEDILYMNRGGGGCGYEKWSRLGPDKLIAVSVMTLMFSCFQVNSPFYTPVL